MKRSTRGILGTTWLRALVAALVLASPALTTRLAPNTYTGGYSRDSANVEARNSSAIAAIMGEFRTSMADMMFIKTERYIHDGIAYGLHLDLEASTQGDELLTKRQATSAAAGSPGGQDESGHVHGPDCGHDHDGHADGDEGHDSPGHVHGPDCDHDHESPESVASMGAASAPGTTGESGHDDHGSGTPTLIRSAEKDFRSFIGDLERAVKPWRPPDAPHTHTGSDELLPWYRVLTLTDPHNIRGYLIGSWWLARNKSGARIDEAISFVQEGIRNNPEAYQLHLMLGNHLRASGKGPDSRTVYRRAADLALKQRPRDIGSNPWWTRYMEEDARASVRMAVLSEKEWGRIEDALRMARKFDAAFEDGDGVLRRQIDEMTSTGLRLEAREP